MSTLPLSVASVAQYKERTSALASVVGFFFVFRVCLTFLFFQSNPVVGTIVAITCDLGLLYLAVLSSAGIHGAGLRSVSYPTPIRWIGALLAFYLISIAWTAAESLIAALAYWVGMAADAAIVLLLQARGEMQHITDDLLKGAVCGAIALALVAWLSPSTADLRMGNDAFLHPNTLGLEIGIATLIAQYLARRSPLWKWLGIALAITLLRTLSKTSIIALVIAECWYLLQNNAMSRAAKLRLAAAALLVIACFWGLLSAYINIYNNTGSGNQAETLTGRTVLWTIVLTMGLDKPWLGHGFYSFRSLVPALGEFQPVHAHNELLQQFFEFGLVGVAIAVGVYWSFFRQARRAPFGELRTLALTLLLFALVRGLTDTTNFGLSFPLWLMAAISLCLPGHCAAEEGSL